MEKSESALTPAIDNPSAKIPLSSTTSVVKRDINQSLRSFFGWVVDVWIRFPDLISQLLNDIEERTKYLEEAVRK
ncbi:hypothetical protein T09_12619 [Trichinella sp. T9]|nr:hypothetical protein T09_12619 [Trichinella sp. T9]